jgi:FtsH-binding integral membrane protein
MTWREWYSDDSAWAILRRGLIVAGIGVVLAVFAQLFWGSSVSRYLWGAVLVPVCITILKLLDSLGKEKTRDSANDKK